MDPTRAALRLELSDGELRCPKKGVLGKGRCVLLQEDLACTCAVAERAGCAIGPVPPQLIAERPAPAARRSSRGPVVVPPQLIAERPAPAPAPSPKKPPAPAPPISDPPGGGFKRWLERKRDEERAAEATPAPPPPPAPTPAPPAETESTMAATQKMLAAMEAEPDREWTVSELAKVHGGTEIAAATAAGWFARRGQLERVKRGVYRWAGGEASKPAKAKAPKAKRSPAAAPPELERPAPAAGDPLARLRWLAEGLVAGHLADEDFVNFALDALGVKR